MVADLAGSEGASALVKGEPNYDERLLEAKGINIALSAVVEIRRFYSLECTIGLLKKVQNRPKSSKID